MRVPRQKVQDDGAAEGKPDQNDPPAGLVRTQRREHRSDLAAGAGAIAAAASLPRRARTPKVETHDRISELEEGARRLEHVGAALASGEAMYQDHQRAVRHAVRTMQHGKQRVAAGLRQRKAQAFRGPGGQVFTGGKEIITEGLQVAAQPREAGREVGVRQIGQGPLTIIGTSDQPRHRTPLHPGHRRGILAVSWGFISAFVQRCRPANIRSCSTRMTSMP